VEKIVSGGYDVEEFLSGLAEHFRNLLIVRSLGTSDLVEASENHKKRYVAITEYFQEEDILRFIRILSDTQVSLKRSVNPRLPLELAMVKMLRLDRTVMIEDLLSKLEKLGGEKRCGDSVPEQSCGKNVASHSINNPSGQNNSENGVPSKEEKSGEETEKKRSLTFDEVQSRWEEVVHRVKRKKVTVGSFLQEGVLLGFDGKIIEIGFGLSNGFHIDAIMRSKELVLEVLREVLEEDLAIRCVKKDLPQKEIVTSKETKEEKLRALGEKEPIIQKIVNDFEAEIVD
ncbi:MAG: hypothetical protein ABIL68_12045, partial [bacterium]